MKFIVPILSVFLIASILSCSKKTGDGFVLEGTIRGAENQLIHIETMKFPSINQYPKYNLIDTARADANGHFEIENYLPERMVCRITVKGNDFNYYIVSLHDEHMHIEADISKQMKPEVTGSPATTVLYSFIDHMRDMNTSQKSIEDSIIKFQYEGNDSLLSVYKGKRLAAEDAYKATLKEFVDTTTEISNAVIGLEGLLFSEDIEFIRQFTQKKKSTADSNSIYLKELSAKIQMQEQLMAGSFIGKPAIDVIQPNPQGTLMKLSDLRGKVVLLDFWASWCGPCRKENPNVVKAYNKYKDKGFVVFSVSLDTDRNNWLAAIEKDGLAWNTHVSVLNDANNQAAMDYRVRGIPMSFLINRDGIIVAENLRGPALEAQLEKLLE